MPTEQQRMMIPIKQQSQMPAMQPMQPMYTQQQTMPQQQFGGGGLEAYMPYVQQAQQLYGMIGGKGTATPGQMMTLAQQLMSQQQGGGMGAAQQTALGKLGTAESLLDSYEQQLTQVGLGNFGPTARIGGMFKTFAGNIGLNPNASVYNDFRDGTVSLLTKSLGEAGSLSDGDIARARSLIPEITDTQKEATMKLSLLRQIIGVNKQNVANAGGMIQQQAPMQQQQFGGGFGNMGLMY